MDYITKIALFYSLYYIVLQRQVNSWSSKSSLCELYKLPLEKHTHTHTCGCYYLHVCMGVYESPWSGRPPPQEGHSWSTGCVPQAWPHESHRSGCVKYQPSARAQGIPRPLGPQVGLKGWYANSYFKMTHLCKCEHINKEKNFTYTYSKP